MQKIKSVLSAFGLILGTTIGAGIFALPHIFYKSGWLTSYVYLAILTFAVIFAHIFFLRTLDATGKRGNLLGLVKDYFGKGASVFGSVSIIGGLLLTLVAYLILGVQFLSIVFPELPFVYALMFFWLVSSAPLIWEKEIFSRAEFWGSMAMGFLILFIFFGANNYLPIIPYADFGLERFVLPFGVILFSLAGWTAIEPLSKILKGNKSKFLILALATILVSVLYVLFVSGIFYSAEDISADTISGLTSWPYIKMAALAMLGLFAVWTSYMPGAVEIKNSLHVLHLNKAQAISLVFFAPVILVLGGMSNFIGVVGLAGGLFLSIQYLLILGLSGRVLRPRGALKWINVLLIAIFILAAIFETYYFLLG